MNFYEIPKNFIVSYKFRPYLYPIRIQGVSTIIYHVLYLLRPLIRLILIKIHITFSLISYIYYLLSMVVEPYYIFQYNLGCWLPYINILRLPAINPVLHICCHIFDRISVAASIISDALYWQRYKLLNHHDVHIYPHND